MFGRVTTIRTGEYRSICVDPSGNLYILHRDCKAIDIIATNGSLTSLPLNSSKIKFVEDISYFRGHLYLVSHHSHNILKISLKNGNVKHFAGGNKSRFLMMRRGYRNGKGGRVLFNWPRGITIDQHDGSVYVADKYNNRIRCVTPTGAVSTCAGDGSWRHKNGPLTRAAFRSPRGVAMGKDNCLYVTDEHDIRKVDLEAQMVSTIAGCNTSNGYRDGCVKTALFHNPYFVAQTKQRALVVADCGNGRIRMVSPNLDQVITICGNWEKKLRDGIGKAASFVDIWSMAYDANSEKLYIIDGGKHLREVCMKHADISQLFEPLTQVSTTSKSDDQPTDNLRISIPEEHRPNSIYKSIKLFEDMNQLPHSEPRPRTRTTQSPDSCDDEKTAAGFRGNSSNNFHKLISKNRSYSSSEVSPTRSLPSISPTHSPFDISPNYSSKSRGTPPKVSGKKLTRSSSVNAASTSRHKRDAKTSKTLPRRRSQDPDMSATKTAIRRPNSLAKSKSGHKKSRSLDVDGAGFLDDFLGFDATEGPRSLRPVDENTDDWDASVNDEFTQIARRQLNRKDRNLKY